MAELTSKRGRIKEDLWAGIAVLTALLFMLFVYAPIELYCYNQDEFWFSLYELLPVIAALFVGGLIISVPVLVLIHHFLPKIYGIVVVPLCCIGYLCTYVQGNFLVNYLPPMDGSEVDWSDYQMGGVQSFVLWIVVTVVIVLAYRFLKGEKFCKAAKLISLCMTLMLTITMVSILLTTGGYEKKTDACLTTKDEYVFSENQNYIVLVIDAADSRTMMELLEENPAYEEMFADFTFYANTMGAYSCTKCAIPQILSGEWYENDVPFEEYDVQAYRDSPILASLEEAGYKLGMYEYDMPYEDQSIYRFSNVRSRNSKISSYVDFAKLEIKLVGLRYAPFVSKEACLFNTNRFGALWERLDEYPAYLSDNKPFYERLLSAEIEKVPENCFKFIHIEGAHAPFLYDENLNEIENGTYEDAMKASMTITKVYLDKLKEAGVYDNSVIVVMADHGFDEELDSCRGRQNPMLLVKGVNEHHDLEISHAPASYVDLQEAFARLLEGKSSSEIFDVKEGDERARRFLYYNFIDENHMFEYISTEHAAENDSMSATGREYIREE